MKIGFIGLGSMGTPIARNLLKKGYRPFFAYNRTRSKAQALASEGAQQVASPADAAREADLVITMLADDAAVESVVFGEHGILGSLPRGAVHASMSTVSPALSARLAKAHREAGQGYLATPVFGRPAAAETAQLSVIVGGAAGLLERCRPVFDAIGQAVFHVGEEPASANVVKVAGNFMLASVIETLGEASTLAEKAGLKPQVLLEIVNQALFKSPVYANYGGIIASRHFSPPGFKLRLGLKDARLTAQAADQYSVPMPLASLIHEHFLAAVAQGQGDLDWAALAEVSARNAGLR